MESVERRGRNRSEKVRLGLSALSLGCLKPDSGPNIEAPVRVSRTEGNESELSSEDTIPRVRRPIRAGHRIVWTPPPVRHSTRPGIRRLPRRHALSRPVPPTRRTQSHRAFATGRVPLMATIARDVMTTDPDCVSHTDTVEEVAMRMRSLLVAFLPVCDEEGYLCGIVGYRDIGAQARSARGEMASVTAASLVEKAPITIGVDDPVEDVTRMMAEQRVWLLPVVDGQRLVGVIHYDSIAGSHRSRLPSQRVESSPSPPGSRARVTGSAVRLLG